ncbi:acyltransferase [Pseudoalteromonas arctica]|nr:acyltransferase [Pseudoalteromonas arctica]
MIKSLFKKSPNFKFVGNKALISKGKFFFPEKIYIGDYCYVGPEAYWYGVGGVSIGPGTLIGPQSTIWTANHNYESQTLVPYDEEIIKKKVTIGSACWLGFGVKICPGINIGDGVVIAMGSVVTKDIPSYSIVGGNPAKIIGQRKNLDEFNQLLKEKKYYLESKNG